MNSATSRRWRSRAPTDRASSCRRGRCWSPPARCRTSPTRRNTRDRSRSTASRSSSRASRPCRKDGDGRRFALEPDPNGFFTSHDTDGKFVTYYGDNHPRYNGNVVKAMASAKHGYPHVVELFADDIAALDPAQQPAARSGVAVAGRRRSTISCWRASSAWSG